MKKLLQKNETIINIFCVIVLVVFAFFVILLLNNKKSFANINENEWDGVTIATSFSIGNGTQENPYIIKNGADLAYFKQVIENDSSNEFNNKFYALGADIDLGNHDFQSIGIVQEDNKNIFRGSFDGCGFTIKRVNLTANVNGFFAGYGLFNVIEDATIKNLNMDEIVLDDYSEEQPVKMGTLAGEVIVSSKEEAILSTISNIAVKKVKINVKTANESNIVGGFLGNVLDKVNIYNIFFQGDLVGDGVKYLVGNSLSDVKRAVVYKSDYEYNVNNDLYIINKENNEYNITLNNEVIDNNSLLKELNKELAEDYYWQIEDGLLSIAKVEKKIEESVTNIALEERKNFAFGLISAPIPLHDSGVDGNTIYVNDLESDYNYYMGLNYSDGRATGTIPTGDNQNLYNDSNLVKVYIKYSGGDFNHSSDIGYVSLDEQVRDFVYYKYYPVKDGLVTFELIDNPYADRPNNKAFNGWITDYVGANITLDMDVYVRSVSIPVTNVNEPISITFYANWMDSATYNYTSGGSWTNAFNALDSDGMQAIKLGDPIYEELDLTTTYIRSTAPRYTYFPDGALNSTGGTLSGYCTTSGGCYYYHFISDSTYDPNVTYYRFINGRMTTFIPEIIGHEPGPYINAGDNPAGYFKQVSLSRGTSLVGYYNNTGVYQSSGSCNSTTCTYYQLMQYYDNNGNPNVFTEGETYYYLVTRDTNIVVLRTNVTAALQNTKPLTLTSVNNGISYQNSATFTISNSRIKANKDLRIEYIKINSAAAASVSNPQSGTSLTKYIYGNYNNLKVGRGLTTSNRTAYAILGGSNGSTGSSSSITRYRLIVESGIYNSLVLVNGQGAGGSIYMDGTVIYGSDYDRITGNNNNLSVYYVANGTFGGNIYSSSAQTGIAMHTIIKSGVFGSSKYDYSTGVYVGGQNSGRHYAAREILVEGGSIYNLVGGPLSGDNRTNINDIYMNIKGGTISMVIGGAGRTETYGNRIISMTGGLVEYAVFGGSNGYSGNNSSSYRGTLTGSTFVYVGGNAQVGSDANVSSNASLFGAEAGSVFGIGNGNASYSTIGTALNSNVIIDGSAKVLKNVYGGGNYGAVGTSASGSSKTNIQILGGEIGGSVYGGGNNNGSGSSSVKSTVNITMNNGNVKGNVFGGSRTKGIVYGDTNVNVLGGIVNTDVYGGGEGGYVNSTTSGTFVSQNVKVKVGNIGSDDNSVNIDGSVYGGSAYGTVNGTTNSTTVANYKTEVEVNSGTIRSSVFGGGKGGASGGRNYTPYVLGSVDVNINGGNIGNVFGGNDAAGSPNGVDNVYLTGGVVGNAYGGGNNTGQKETHIFLQGTVLNNLFGGSNASGTVNTSNVKVTSGTVKKIYGGNNVGGITDKANVEVDNVNISGDIYGGGSLADANSSVVKVYAPNINNVYGGGEQASVDTTDVTIDGSTGKSIFGGSNISGTVNSSKVTIDSGTLDNVYGGNNSGGTTVTTNVFINNGIITSVFGGGDNAESTTSNVTVNNGQITNVFGGGNEAGLTTSNVNMLGGTTTNVFGGSNNSGNLTEANVVVGVLNKVNDINVSNVYGGNNKGGKTSLTDVDINYGNIVNLYGGGNEAPVDETDVKVINAEIFNIYGGGNAAAVNRNTFLDIDDSTLTSNVYGGGNQGVVLGNTETYITNCTIAGSAYAGGNGATAIVSGDTSITIDGQTEVGTTSSKAPEAGCVFGGGNAAATGSEEENNSIAIVNIVGATVHGNVYGGANTSVVYGKTFTNIGMEAVEKKNLLEDDINIVGTVFGGGEANASGSEIYDWDFISVTDAIDIKIDGTGYIANNHKFLLTGSIFGSGNASSSQGTSSIYIKNLGTNDEPSRNISIQRTNDLVIDHSVMELEGIQDRTNEYSDIPYSFNQIDKLTIKNGTTLLLQRNANLLKEFYSGVDEGGEVVPAVVDINDETKKLTKNVDNRIYINPNNNLNVTTNQAATTYGKVTGMTFFGMYNSYSSGSLAYGIYSRDYNYGDAANAGDVIIGGSYVLGLHSLNHDITKDGFYSNYITDDYTMIETKYIDPSPVGDTGYRWIIGLSAINYRFTLTASKYSSLGTYELSMMDFAEGNTTFELLGFNVEGLKEGVNLIDSDLVPKVTDTEEEANKLLGLAMKSETREWTSYNSTKLLSENKGTYVGDEVYVTDRLATAPSLMFYLYHAKNISLDDELGTVVITMQALIPINEIEYTVNLVTITIDLMAKNYNDGDAYDASISYDKKYEMPSATSVKITNRSQFTAYYSIIASSNEIDDFYGKDNSNYHVLVTDYAFPVGTQITMLDYGVSEENPEYYYFTITQDIYDQSVLELQNNNEVTYRLSDFVKMGSTSLDNTYDDKVANEKYYSTKFKRTIEEFLFIFDLKETTTTEEVTDKNILFELRNNEDFALITVLGIRQGLMKYSLYNSGNQVLRQRITYDSNYVYHEVAADFNLTSSVTYDQTDNREAIIDTNYESNAMGLNIFLIDDAGNQASSSLLLGTTIMMDDNLYFADGDGVWRINLAGKVSNLSKKISLIPDTLLPAGNYTLRFVLFASSDGLHNASTQDGVVEDIPIVVVGDNNTLVVNSSDKSKVVDGETGLNAANSKINSYSITYRSVLTNPNLRLSVMKRDIDDYNATTYTEVDFNSLFSNHLENPTDRGYQAGSDLEKMLPHNLNELQTLNFTFNDNLTSGTYKLVFKLYDDNQIIEEDYEYIIIKKKIVD